MTNEKHKAIFKGVINEKVWYVNDNIICLKRLQNDLHGMMRRREYYDSTDIKEIQEKINNFKRILSFVSKDHFLKYEEIWSGEISRPILQVGEDIYINDLDILVEVRRKYRTTNDEIIYEISHIIKNIDTDKTEESRLKAIYSWFKLLYPDYDKFEQLKSEFIEPVVEETELEKEEWKPSWEQEEKKEKTWFGWLKK